jgi:hypothetical protein
MPLEQILALLRARPFVPFRIHLLDGTAYEVRHPEWLLPGSRSVIIGQHTNPKLPYIEDGRHVSASLLSISRLEPLPENAASGNGQTGA